MLTLGLTSIIWAIRSNFGIVELGDLKFFDLYFRLKPTESIDEKIIIVGITENDLNKLDKYPISDDILAKLVNKVKAQKPVAIGLDIIRDKAQPPGEKNIAKTFQETTNLIGVGSLLKDSNGESIQFPPILKKNQQIADIAVPVDRDSKIRRGYLFTGNEEIKTFPSLSFKLAFLYLRKYCVRGQQIELDYKLIISQSQNSDCQNLDEEEIKETFFKNFSSSDGGYVFGEDGFFQIIINWRKNPQPFKEVSLFDVLDDKIDEELFSDKIVLIGSMSPSVGDTFVTPLSFKNKQYISNNYESYGVVNIAHLTSQILNTVLENRPTIKTVSDYWEFLNLWLILLLFNYFFIGIDFLSPNYTKPGIFFFKISIFVIISNLVLFYIHYILFLFGYWIPIVPILIGINITAMIQIIIGLNRYKEEKNLIQNLNAIMTNEISEPIFQLNNLIENSDAIKEKLPDLDKRKELLLIKENLQFLSDVLTKVFPSINVISYAKVENLNDWLQEIVTKETAQMVFKDYNVGDITITFNLDPKLNSFHVLPKQIEFIVSSLFKNSVESLIEKQQLKKSFKGKINLKTTKNSTEIFLVVEDNGLGIEPNSSDFVFEPCYTTKNEHNGLGLYFCHEIMQKISGEIVFSSSPFCTKFTVKIPYQN